LCYDAFFSYDDRKTDEANLRKVYNLLKNKAGDVWKEYQAKDTQTFWSSDYKKYSHYVFAPLTLGITLLPTSNTTPISYHRPSYQDIITECDQRIARKTTLNFSQVRALQNLMKEADKLEREKIADEVGAVGSYDRGILNFVQQVTWGFIKLGDEKNIVMKKDDKIDHFKIERMTKSHVLMSINNTNNKMWIAVVREANQKYIKGSSLEGKYFIFKDTKEFVLSPDNVIEILVFKRVIK